MNYLNDRIATIKKTTEILHKYSINAKKSFGQNFMIAPTIPQVISEHPSITKETLVIEIGPGIGALTQFLLEKAKKVICYEIDSDLIPVLQNELASYDNLIINNQDFLKVDLKEIDFGDYKNVVVVSNLPYYITSELLIKLLLDEKNFTILAMMQKEVAQRILKGSRGEENELTVFAKYFSKISKVTEVSKNDFFPRPNVNSTVLCFEKMIVDYGEEFVQIIKILFSQRRKTIGNNLKKWFSDDKKVQTILEESNITVLTRVDELDWNQLLKLVNSIRIHL